MSLRLESRIGFVYSPNVPKPMGEALAENEPTILDVDGVRLDTLGHLVTSRGHKVELTDRQTQILAYLMRRPHQILSPEAILAELYKGNKLPKTANSMLSLNISNIREAIDGNSDYHIFSIDQYGYSFGLPLPDEQK